MFNLKRPKIGLALGAGGSKGLAHIGVIKILEENNINIDCIAGSSFGAITAGFYAAKKNILEIEQLALKTNWPQFFSMLLDPSFKQGLISGSKIMSFIEDNIGDINFEDLQIPFCAVVTDLKTGKPVIINKGKVSSALRASMSIPFFFKPEIINDRLYIDGGVSMPIPVDAVRKMGADIVIAVNLSQDYAGLTCQDKFGAYTVLNKTIDIFTHYLANDNVKNADITVCPKVGKVGLFDKFLTEEGSHNVILLGEEAMNKSLPKLLNLINQKNKGIFTYLKNIFKKLGFAHS